MNNSHASKSITVFPFAVMLFVCFPLVIMQTVYIFIPSEAVRLFNQVLRPLIFGLLAVYVYVFIGKDARPAAKDYYIKVISVISVAVYGLIFLLTAYFNGIGTNIMAANPSMKLWNLWHWGTVVLFGELIRYKLLKNAQENNRAVIFFVVTLVLAYAQMNDLRYMVNGELALQNFIFVSLMQGIIISSVASYYAVAGGFIPVILTRGVYTMVPLLVPMLPQIQPIPWALIVCLQGAASISVIFYFGNRDQRIRVKRAAKYEKKPFARYAAIGAVWVLFASFLLGFLPLYPVVILTDSMAGTFDRGSIVFMQRAADTQLEEMDIIHFNQGGLAFVHRVVDFTYDGYGTREYITQGDASDIVDPFPVAREDINGIALFFFPYVGFPVVWINAMMGWRL